MTTRLHFAGFAPQHGRARWVVALGVALAAHAVALVVLTQVSRPELQAKRPSVSRTRGVIAVRLQHVPAAISTPTARIKTVIRVRRASAKQPPQRSSASQTELAPMASPSAPTGAEFAGLFTPIIQAPMGRGRWGRAAPPRPVPNETAWREQAALALRLAVQDRLSNLSEALHQGDQVIACKIGIDTDHRHAAVQCDNTSDEAMVWAYLQGLPLQQPAPESQQLPMCFMLTSQLLSCPP